MGVKHEIFKKKLNFKSAFDKKISSVDYGFLKQI
jgi:hypothetical protein